MKRKTITNSYWWGEQMRKVRNWFNPRQKWLFKKIPNHWVDAVELLPLSIFEIFRHFVEDEEGLEAIWGDRYLNDPYISEEYEIQRKPIRKELEDIYKYVKYERSELEKELDGAYPTPISRRCMLDRLDPIIDENGTEVIKYKMKSCEEIYGKPYNEAYAEVHRLEALIEEKDTWAMMGIIKNRIYLWS